MAGADDDDKLVLSYAERIQALERCRIGHESDINVAVLDRG
jgi:hypothetical protein